MTELLQNSTSAREYSRLLVKVAENCSSDDGVLKFVFSKAQTILGLNSAVTSSGTANRAELFKAADGSLPESSFKQAMLSSDTELRLAASRCLAFLLTQIPGDVDGFITWLVVEMAAEDALTRIAQIVPAASIVFQIPQAREIFVAQGGVTHLVNMISGIGSNGNAQQLYDLSFCLWMLSMSIKSGVPAATFLSSGSIAVAADLLAAAPSRKVVRVVVAFLHNLGQAESAPVLTEMFAHGVQRYLENMVQSNSLAQANDIEFEADAKDLYQTLMRNYRELSTFECWAAEVTSGKLRWGICHTEKFWRENARFLEDGDFKLLKVPTRHYLFSHRASTPTPTLTL